MSDKKTKTVKVIEVYETTIEVPAHLSIEERSAYAFREVKILAVKPVRTACRYSETPGKIWKVV